MKSDREWTFEQTCMPLGERRRCGRSNDRGRPTTAEERPGIEESGALAPTARNTAKRPPKPPRVLLLGEGELYNFKVSPASSTG